MYFDKSIIDRAVITYPDLPETEACLKLLQDIMNATAPIHTPREETKLTEVKPCSGCGGGKVR
jgi:hypothetical protein